MAVLAASPGGSVLQTVTWIVTFVVSWSTLYLVLCLFTSSMSHLMRSRVIAFVHSSTVVVLAGLSLFWQGPTVFSAVGEPSTNLHHTIFMLSLGYFLFEFAWCVYFKTEGATMITHHILVIVVYVRVIGIGILGSELCAIVFGGELSNPFLQMRYFLKALRRERTWYGQLNDIVFLSVFLFMRVVMGSWLAKNIILSNDAHFSLDIRLCCTLLYVISWLFSVAVIRYGFRKAMRRHKKVEEKDDSEEEVQTS